jgi:hypothetical protein
MKYFFEKTTSSLGSFVGFWQGLSAGFLSFLVFFLVTGLDVRGVPLAYLAPFPLLMVSPLYGTQALISGSAAACLLSTLFLSPLGVLIFSALVLFPVGVLHFFCSRDALKQSFRIGGDLSQDEITDSPELRFGYAGIFCVVIYGAVCLFFFEPLSRHLTSLLPEWAGTLTTYAALLNLVTTGAGILVLQFLLAQRLARRWLGVSSLRFSPEGWCVFSGNYWFFAFALGVNVLSFPQAIGFGELLLLLLSLLPFVFEGFALSQILFEGTSFSRLPKVLFVLSVVFFHPLVVFATLGFLEPWLKVRQYYRLEKR